MQNIFSVIHKNDGLQLQNSFFELKNKTFILNSLVILQVYNEILTSVATIPICMKICMYSNFYNSSGGNDRIKKNNNQILKI